MPSNGVRNLLWSNCIPQSAAVHPFTWTSGRSTQTSGLTGSNMTAQLASALLPCLEQINQAGGLSYPGYTLRETLHDGQMVSRIAGCLGRSCVLRDPPSTCTWWIWIGWSENWRSLASVFQIVVVLLITGYDMKNFCNLIGLEQGYFSLIWNTYMWKLQTFCG